MSWSASIPPAPRAPQFLVGRDVSNEPRPAPRGKRPVAAIAVTAVLCMLAIAGLRVSILRARSELGRAMAEEKRLGDELARLRVEVRELRGPHRLESLAAGLGLVEPAHVVDLDTLHAAIASAGSRR